MSPGIRKFLAITVPAAAVVTLLLMIATEVWVRLAMKAEGGTPGFYLTDPMRRQRLAPNYNGWFAGVPVRINSLGLRDDREYDLGKRPNTFRILVLGDSVTFGHGAVHPYPALLEDKLRAWRPDVDWQVWNAAVPGYNTSQELAHLLEVGSAFQPDLVIVGFYPNDVIDNYTVEWPSRWASWKSDAISFVRRHLYSFELYRKVYLTIRWRMAGSAFDHRLLEHLAAQDEMLGSTASVVDAPPQQLTPYDRLTDDEVVPNPCPRAQQADPEEIAAMQREPSWPAWIRAVRELQRLHTSGAYRIMFFLNVVPPACMEDNVFYPGGMGLQNDLFTREMGQGTPVFSVYDTFLHRRPQQMPSAGGHAVGNSNLTKAEALFGYLKGQLFPAMSPPALALHDEAGRTAR